MKDTEKTEDDPMTVRDITILGAGTMGHGIAQVAAVSGYRVILRDVDLKSLARGVQAIERNLEILPRPQWTSTAIQPGDRYEIVHFVGGG